MVLHSYGMLLPCGIDRFHGTEYVCCPSTRPEELVATAQEEDEDEDEDEEVELDEDEEDEAIEER